MSSAIVLGHDLLLTRLKSIQFWVLVKQHVPHNPIASRRSHQTLEFIHRYTSVSLHVSYTMASGTFTPAGSRRTMKTLKEDGMRNLIVAVLGLVFASCVKAQTGEVVCWGWNRRWPIHPLWILSTSGSWLSSLRGPETRRHNSLLGKQFFRPK